MNDSSLKSTFRTNAKVGFSRVFLAAEITLNAGLFSELPFVHFFVTPQRDATPPKKSAKTAGSWCVAITYVLG